MNDKSSMKRSVLLACILCAFVRAESASFDVAVVGAGPAGIALRGAHGRAYGSR